MQAGEGAGVPEVVVFPEELVQGLEAGEELGVFQVGHGTEARS